jgi:hypothetical protein
MPYSTINKKNNNYQFISTYFKYPPHDLPYIDHTSTESLLYQTFLIHLRAHQVPTPPPPLAEGGIM